MTTPSSRYVGPTSQDLQGHLTQGSRVKFADDRFWWTVQACSEHFTALTRLAAFDHKTRYTVIDWDTGIRGACNLIGNGWGDGTYSPEQCAEMLTEFEQGRPEVQAAHESLMLSQGRTSWPSRDTLEISHRNRVALRILKVAQP